jgi:hypothetical protein
MTLKEGGAGRPKAWSNVCRSLAILGEPKASTMTMVSPLPLMPWLKSGWRLYARWSWKGS